MFRDELSEEPMRVPDMRIALCYIAVPYCITTPRQVLLRYQIIRSLQRRIGRQSGARPHSLYQSLMVLGWGKSQNIPSEIGT